MSKKANWGTLYRLLMEGGKYSEKHVEKVKSQFDAADDSERSELLRKYRGSAKKSQQNKSMDGSNSDTKQIDDEDTKPVETEDTKEDKKLASTRPSKKGKNSRSVRVKRSGRKG